MKNKKYSFFKLICVGLAAFVPFAGQAQITVTDNQTAAQLAQNLVGGGVTISNATLNCPGGGNGVFNVTSSNLGLNDGIILTSGSSTLAAGPAANYPDRKSVV